MKTRSLLICSLLFAVACGVLPNPLAKPTPLPTVPPLVAEVSPTAGETLPTDGAIVLYFDQAMQADSVEKAVSFSPAVSGKWQWLDDRTAQFTPNNALAPAQRYTLTIANSATSIKGIPLAQSVDFTVDTEGLLTVSELIPADGSAEIGVDSSITVIFNRPVVPLLLSSDAKDLPQPLSISPALAGKGEWVNTSIYVFRPSQPLAGATTYTVQVQPGGAGTALANLQETVTSSFTTLAPAVLSVEVETYDNRVPLDAPIRVLFNQPMNRTAVESAITLNSLPFLGKYEWSDDGLSVAITADPKLQHDTAYTFAVGRQAKAASGEVGLAQDFEQNFVTLPLPKVIKTEPADGEKEVPSYRGISVDFNTLMDEESLKKHIKIDPPPANDYNNAYFSSYGFEYYLNTPILPTTDYTLTIGADVQDVYGNRLGQEQVIHFRSADIPPHVYLALPGEIGLFSAYAPTELFYVFTNTHHLQAGLWRMSVEDFGRFQDWSEPNFRENYNPNPDQAIVNLDIPVEPVLNETIYQKVPLPAEGVNLPPGLYYLKTIHPINDEPLRHFLIVADVNISLKSTYDQAAVWVTDMQSGLPVAGRQVVLYGRGNKVLAEGVTDANGYWQTALANQTNEALWLMAVADARDQDPAGLGITTTDWVDGIAPWSFNVPTSWQRQTQEGYLYTDRPIYRPGQVVYFKGLLRQEDDARFQLPEAGHKVTISITNDQYEEIYRQNLPVNDYGTLNGEVQLSEDAGTGSYRLLMQDGENFSREIYFTVAEFVKPEFQVKLTPEKPAYLAGETVRATVESTFFFGGGVSNADVSYTVLTADYSFPWTGDGWYSFYNYDETADVSGPTYGVYGEVLAQGSGKTDGSGKFVIELPANLGDRIGSQLFTIEATVADLNQRIVSGRTEVVVHRGEFYVGINAKDYVSTAGEPAEMQLITTDWQSQAAPNQTVNVTAAKVEWFNVQEEDEFGNKVWTWERKETQVYTGSTTTAGDGRGQISFTPADGGTYRVTASAQDSKGNSISASTYIWVSDTRYVSWRQDNSNRIRLITDKKEYQPGDTAEILIASPFQGTTTALVTVERGRISYHEVLTLTGNSTVYRLPITAEHAPNVFVSVILVKGVDETNPAPAFRMGMAELKVSNAQQEVLVSLTPDKQNAGPGDEVTYSVYATDYSGKPVQAEFSLALVDLAVLSLSAPNSQPILNAFYSTRPLSVQTSTALMFSVQQVNIEVNKLKGGGGGAADAAAPFVTIRGDFRDTAYWNAEVRTDAQGKAQVTVKLPDNLTTWRLDARGVTLDTLVGQAQTDIISSKPLLIRPVTPRFFVVGDQVELQALVNNNTDNALSAVVELSGTGYDLQGESQQTVEIPARGRALVKWQGTIPDVSGVDLVFSVRSGEFSDASRPPAGIPPTQTLPVYRYIAPETVGTAGALDSAEALTEEIVLPRRYDASQGQLNITLSPSLAASTVDGLTYLEHYPYECTEQTISRFLPNVVTYRTLKELGLDDPALQKHLEELLSVGLQRLYKQQHSDGGWGWWTTEQSNPYITSYVVFGLTEAQKAGFAVSEKVLNDGVRFLKQRLKAPLSVTATWERNRQVYMLFALANAGAPDSGMNSLYYDKRLLLDTYARALLLKTLALADPSDLRLPTLQSDLNTAVVMSATGAQWHEVQGVDYWNMNTDLRTTAMAISALAQTDPQNPILPNAVRWLMSARAAHGGWQTTQETAWSLLALTDWMKVTGELQGNYSYTVTVNGQELSNGQVNADNLRDPQRLTVAIADLIKEQANQVVFERGEGTGNLYYTAHLTVYQPVPDIQALSKGMTVSRKYELQSPNCGGSEQDACPPISSAQVGDIINVTVSLIAPADLHYLVLEDPFPSGAEPIDTSLLTTSILAEGPELGRTGYYRGWGWWWFSNTDLRDEKLVLSASYLPAGTYEYTYQLRAGLPGQYNVIPTTAYEFYFPEVFARGQGMLFEIK
ncbi:MAG TPA: Ig-like domain-containing protein [Anaerolineales bacterium]|nr:Ig-like domain-containing protein [Anaerolineales bacterium]